MTTRRQIVAGAIYAALFLFAVWASLQQERADSVARSVLWGSVSMYVLLWCLAWFLRDIYRRLAALIATETAGREKWREQDRLITVVAVIILGFNGFFVCRASTFTDPLQAAHHATVTLWATIFFLVWYAIGTASLVARIGLNHQPPEEKAAPPRLRGT
jgi:hypothetical protein